MSVIGIGVEIVEKNSAVGYDWEKLNDIGKYGIMPGDSSTFYDDGEALMNEINSGKAFDTGWHGFYKDFCSIYIRRETDGGELIIEVCRYMDEDAELVSDCEYGDYLTEEEVDKALDMWEGCSEAYEKESMPCFSTLDEVLDKLGELNDACNDKLEEDFADLDRIVTHIANTRGENEDEEEDE